MSEVTLYTSPDAFRQLAPQWNALARDVAFRELDWHRTWWKHYGNRGNGGNSRQLYLLAVRDEEGQLLGIAPWFVEQDRLLGRTIRNLGSGEICTDYLSLLSAPCNEQHVAECIASFLADQAMDAESPEAAWNVLDLDSVNQLDTITRYLVDALDDYGLTVYPFLNQGLWRIELPGTDEEYLQSITPQLRNRIRSAEKSCLKTGKSRLILAETQEQVEQGYQILQELHQAVWIKRGQAGNYASESFRGFHEEMLFQLHRANKLRLTWLEHEGKPVAAEYDILGREILYNYQVGRDPSFSTYPAGNLLRYLNIRWSIQNGFRMFDFLRGDEPYKQDWRASKLPQQRVQLVSSKPIARFRHGLWTVGRAAKRWWKRQPVGATG